jgi:hypothetical protein
MCDQNLVGFFLLAAEIALITASIMLMIAIEQGRSIFTAFSSVGYSVTTAAFIAAGIASLAAAAAALSSGCLGGACGSQAAALMTAINVAIGTLSGVLALVLVGTFIPGAAAIAGPGALIMLLGAGGSFVYLGAMAATLVTCLSAAVGTVGVLLGIAAAFAFVTGAVMIIVAIYGIVVTIMTVMAAASG